MNVARLVLDSIERFGELPAGHFEGTWFTNVPRLRRAERLAAVLQAYGVGVGDRVVIMMPNSPDVMGAFHAIWRIGAVIVPVTPQLNADEVRYLIASSGAEVV